MKTVKGYMLRTVDMLNDGKEQLFAVEQDGAIKTCVKDYSSSFVEKGVKWVNINELPEDAEYIGLYKM